MSREILDEKKAKEIKMCDNNIQIELNVESKKLLLLISSSYE